MTTGSDVISEFFSCVKIMANMTSPVAAMDLMCKIKNFLLFLSMTSCYLQFDDYLGKC